MTENIQTIISETELIVNDNIELNGDLIISTNGVLEIHDVSYIGIPQGSGHKIILDTTSSKLVIIGGGPEVPPFLSTFVDFKNGATDQQILSDNLPCLLGETKVKTSKGYVKVENLKKGDVLVNDSEREMPIVEIYKSEIKTTTDNSPYIIPAHYFSRNYPKKQFKISPLHAIATNKKALEWCIPNIHCKSVKRMPLGETITYYHIELQNWLTDHITIEGGTIVESFGKTFHGTLDSVFYVRSNKTGYYKRDMNMYNEVLKLYNKNKIKKKKLDLIFK